jgi:RES domain-containing protein
VAARWADAAFDGEGAGRAGGRWNSRGVRVVYLPAHPDATGMVIGEPRPFRYDPRLARR